MTTSAYFAKTDLENRLSATVVRKLFDDDNSGTADTTPLARLISDASSKVDSYLRSLYTLPLASPYPNEVVRLALDVAVAYCAQRHPEVMKREWVPLMEQVEKDLKRLRMGETRLDVVSTPEPAANTGATVIYANAEREAEAAASSTGDSTGMFVDMGSFSR